MRVSSADRKSQARGETGTGGEPLWIFSKIYGEEVVKERPWRVAEKDGCYVVTGSMPQSGSGVIVLGGVAQLKLQKDDGRVWVFYHGK